MPAAAWGAIDESDAEIAQRAKFVTERQVGRLGVVGLEPDHGARDRGELPAALAPTRREARRIHVRVRPSPGGERLRPVRPADAARAARSDSAGHRARRDAARRGLARQRRRPVRTRRRRDDWIARSAFPETLRALFCEVGRVYAPFLLANARALEAGAARVGARSTASRGCSSRSPTRESVWPRCAPNARSSRRTSAARSTRCSRARAARGCSPEGCSEHRPRRVRAGDRASAAPDAYHGGTPATRGAPHGSHRPPDPLGDQQGRTPHPLAGHGPGARSGPGRGGRPDRGVSDQSLGPRPALRPPT